MKQCTMLKFDLAAYQKAQQKMKDLALSDDPELDVFKRLRVEPAVIRQFQNLFDTCRCATFFSGQCPRLIVERVIEVHHECTRAEYLLRRSQLVADCDSGQVKQIGVKSQEVDMQ